MKVLTHISPKIKELATNTELTWINYGVKSVYANLGTEDPINSYIRMNEEERMVVLQQIANDYAQQLGIETCYVSFSEELAPNDCGGYLCGKNAIVINKLFVGSQPMTEAIAVMALVTIIHEMFHAFQDTVIASQNPEQYGVSQFLAACWKNNLRKGNYCTFEQNPKFYQAQAVEFYADNIAQIVINMITDTDN